MKLIIGILSITLVFQVYRVSILLLKKEKNIAKVLIEILILILMIYSCYINMDYTSTNKINKFCYWTSIITIVYVLISFLLQLINNKKMISILSIKNAIDKSNNGIMFLDKKENIFLINKTMENILKELNIKKDFIKNFQKKSFKIINEEYLLKCIDKICQIKTFNNKEIVAIDITDIYKLNIEYENQNKKIKKYNKKIQKNLNNIEQIEKSKNLIKIKNEFHDLLGHRLSLFKSYLNNKKININDIKFMIDNLFIEDQKETNYTKKLNRLVEIYKVLEININIKGSLSKEKNIQKIFYEIIRESITNAIIHGGSRNINIDISKNTMIITNDGTLPTKKVKENEGIKGMRRKLNEINGTLTIDYKNKFILKIEI